jgi:chromosome transmission fidelity protein 18
MFQVNSQVIKPQERALLLRLVEIMVSFELRFVQEKTEDGQNVYRLDPWVLHDASPRRLMSFIYAVQLMCLLPTMASALKISQSLGMPFDSWSPLRFVTLDEYDVTILTRPKIDAALVAKQADAVEKGKEHAKANFFKTSVYLFIRCLHRSFHH